MQFDFNPFFNGRFVFENEQEKIPKNPAHSKSFLGNTLTSMGSYAWLTEGAEAEAPGKEIAKDTGKALEEAKKEVEETEDQKKKREELAAKVPDKLTQQKQESLKRRMIIDIYGNDKELSEKYFKAVKEAIEKISKDELYEFIKAHTPPTEAYEKGEHEKWNKEFCALLDKHLAGDLKAGEDVARQRYIVGGLQNYLVNDFIPANVFQAGRSERMTNPFIWVDGKMGAYTMSVMAEYWNKKYGQESKDKEPLIRADIDKSLASTKKNKELYDGALAYLSVQLKQNAVVPSQSAEGAAPEVAAAKPAGAKETRKEKMERLKAELRAELVKKGATKEVLFAFEMAYDDRFISKIKPAMAATENFDKTDPDSWAAVHNALIGDTKYATTFASWSPEEAVPATNAATASTGTGREGVVRLPDSEIVARSEETEPALTSEEIGKKLKELRSVVFVNAEWRMSNNERARSVQQEDYTKLRDKKNMDPDTWFLDFDKIPGSAPDIAFKKYKELYKNVEDEGGNPVTDTEVLKAFGALGKVIAEYYKNAEKVTGEEKAKIIKKFYPLIAQYDLPKGFNLDHLESFYYDDEGNSIENHYYLSQREKVLPETLRSNEGMTDFIDRFFTQFPTKTLKNIDDLKKFLKLPVEDNLSLIKNYADNDAQLISRLNEAIWFRNMYQVQKEISKLQEELNKSVDARIKTADETIIAQYFPPEKKNVEVASK